MRMVSYMVGPMIGGDQEVVSTYQPAARESARDFTHGVSIHGVVAIGGGREPILCGIYRSKSN